MIQNGWIRISNMFLRSVTNTDHDHPPNVKMCHFLININYINALTAQCRTVWIFWERRDKSITYHHSVQLCRVGRDYESCAALHVPGLPRPPRPRGDDQLAGHPHQQLPVLRDGRGGGLPHGQGDHLSWLGVNILPKVQKKHLVVLKRK